jgi:catechol 2,3-dioxygenase-like lactoylglutathione lyase family enzyme
MSSEWSVQSLFHFVVNVTRLERSLDFYQKLGFRILRDNRDVVWPASVAENFGMAVAQGRGALLALGEGPDHTRLDLIEWLEPRWPGPATGRASADAIPRIMALRTKNVRAAYAALSAEGVEFIGTPRDPDPAIGVESVVCCRNPDGYVVELIEYIGDRLGSRIDDLPTRSR